ncbi:MAG: quinone-dependent dihydroorotate dehydrogenase [Pseudomonadota bacterium]
MSGGAAWRRRLERAGLALLRRADPEAAHRVAIAALAQGLGPDTGPVRLPRLTTDLAGLRLPNLLGIAAGFDKNADAALALSRAGPGFVELGAVTPRPQEGNPLPRVFRLRGEAAIINRLGFNNDGMDAMQRRLGTLRAAHPDGLDVPLGLNLGANKDSADRAADYETLIRYLGPLADFLTINVSSPNTERLRDLQGPAALDALLGRAKTALGDLAAPPPLFLKIAPDIDEPGLDAVAEVAQAHALSGIVATNTTLSREGVAGRYADQAGGLSGPPLLARSTTVLSGLRARLGAAIPLIGVGGITTAEDAYAKIRAGASALQLYTALAYRGLWHLHDLAEGLDGLLARDGYASADAAVGADVDAAATRASSAG